MKDENNYYFFTLTLNSLEISPDKKNFRPKNTNLNILRTLK